MRPAAQMHLTETSQSQAFPSFFLPPPCPPRPREGWQKHCFFIPHLSNSKPTSEADIQYFNQRLNYSLAGFTAGDNPAPPPIPTSLLFIKQRGNATPIACQIPI
jgi:hypothetical protein